METKKIIKSPDVLFFEDKTHLEDYPSGRIDKAPAVKVNISPKSDVEDLDANNNVSEQDEKPNMEEEAEANVPAAKSTPSGETSKLNTGKKNQTAPNTAT